MNPMENMETLIWESVIKNYRYKIISALFTEMTVINTRSIFTSYHENSLHPIMKINIGLALAFYMEQRVKKE